MTLNTARLDQIFHEEIQTEVIPSAVCLIKKDGRTIYHNAFGMASKSTKQQARPSTIYDIASLTKIVTTTLILKMCTDKRISIDQTIDRVLPSIRHYPQIHCRLQHTTIRHLLIHESGLPAWYPFYTEADKPFLDVLEQILTQYKKEEEMVYSDLNFMLLGEILTYQYEKELGSVFTDQLAGPLHLKTMQYGPVYSQSGEIAATEAGNQTEQKMCEARDLSFEDWRTNGEWIHGEVNDGNSFYYFNGVAGHAGLFSDASDLAEIGELYVQEQHLIDEELKKEAIHNHGQGRGLGWQFADVFPEGCGHTGFTGPSLWISPGHNLVCVILTNRQHQPHPQDIKVLRKRIHDCVLEDLLLRGDD